MHCDGAATQGSVHGKAHPYRVFRLALLAFSAALTYSVMVGVRSDGGSFRSLADVQISGQLVFGGQVGMSLDGIASTGHAKASNLASVHSKSQGKSRGDTHLGLLLAVLVGLS
jgi:hypothetical protein